MSAEVYEAIAESLYHQPCRVKILDTENGDTTESSDRSPYYWHEGNGSCDCNRELAFDDAEMDDSCSCLGRHRYLIVERDYAGVTLRELNEGYPEALLAKAGIA